MKFYYVSSHDCGLSFVSLQEGVTGTWFPAWLLLQERTLIYTKSLEPAFAVNLEHLDLRKARCIGKV